MSKIFEQLVAARGFEPDFLRPKYEQCLAPSGLPDIDAALQRIRRAKVKNEKCLIYGDYDVDGVTASTVMYDALRLAGLTEIEIMLPNRFADGYGMSKKIVQRAVSDKISLVLTVDCGSRNHEIVSELAAQGIDTIITDHHECGQTLPDAIAVINPKRKDQQIEPALRELAGAGVAFKLAQAMVTDGLIPDGQEKWLLDLVAIGTVCDSMKLTGENRRLCHYGMLVLEKTRRLGLRELMSRSGVRKLSSDAIGFQIGPRLNAAGRMKSADLALQLLRADKRTQAARLADELETLNSLRKQQQTAAVQEITARGIGDDPVIIERGTWHEGVLGIIAGRLTEQYQKPAFVLTEIDGELKGSGRSFGEFNLAAALDACREYIIGGGGHAEACGVKLVTERFTDFRHAINTFYRSLNLTNQERFLEIHEDLAVDDFAELSLELMDELRLLEPFGEGNPVPIFYLPAARVVDASRLGTDGQHLRLTIWDKNEHGLKLMQFNSPESYLKIRPGDTVDAWITLEENVYRGIRSVEGRIVKIA